MTYLIVNLFILLIMECDQVGLKIAEKVNLVMQLPWEFAKQTTSLFKKILSKLLAKRWIPTGNAGDFYRVTQP